MTHQQLTSKIAMAMGGRAAEALVFGEEKVTNGAASDIQQVTSIAEAMVTEYGMSEDLGPVGYNDGRQGYIGGGSPRRSISGETAMMIDNEVRRIVDTGYDTAVEILTQKSGDLERLAQGLLEYETLTGKEIDQIIAGEKLDRGESTNDAGDSGTGGSSISAVPKTKPKPSGEPPAMEPQPS